MTSMARSWTELAESFLLGNVSDPDFNLALIGIGNLCNWLSKHAVDWPLFGFSSLNTLIITQIEPQYPLSNSIQRLTIEPQSDGRVVFRFKQSGFANADYNRVTPPEEIILQMCKFLKQIGWVKVVTLPNS